MAHSNRRTELRRARQKARHLALTPEELRMDKDVLKIYVRYGGNLAKRLQQQFLIRPTWEQTREARHTGGRDRHQGYTSPRFLRGLDDSSVSMKAVAQAVMGMIFNSILRRQGGRGQ